MHALIELINRYWEVWRHGWRRRENLTAPARLPYEIQFLPAALALQEQPVHPAPRIFTWLILALGIVAISWATLGKVDVVAVAPGKVFPAGKIKLIQPKDASVVKAIHVADGQAVKTGELLIELDPTISGADVKRLQSELSAAHIDTLRARAMLDAIERQRRPDESMGLAKHAPSAVSLDIEQLRLAQQWLQGHYAEYRANVETAESDIQQRSADLQAAQAQVSSLSKAVAIATQLAADYRRLSQDQYVARHEYLQKEQARIDLERQLHVHQANIQQFTASREEAITRRASVIAQTRRVMLDLLQDASRRESSAKHTLEKALYEEASTYLRAPVDGVVQQLAVHTVGGVVTPAQPLMVVVPSDAAIEVEAILNNKDVGFVRPGQPATVKIDTFNYNKYGTVAGEVQSISQDAIEDPKHGLVYSCRIRLKQDHLMIDGQRVALTPGMAVSAEIKTDQRRVIGYLLSPLQRHVQEGLRER
jgi:hemolysin D